MEQNSENLQSEELQSKEPQTKGFIKGFVFWALIIMMPGFGAMLLSSALFVVSFA